MTYMKYVLISAALVAACLVGWFVYDRVNHMAERMDYMADRMNFLGEQLKESNRLLSHVEDATLKLAKALP